MKRQFCICDFYLLLVGLSLLGAKAFPMAITKTFLLAIMVVSLYFFVSSNSKYKLPLYFRALNPLILVFTIYGILFLFSGGAIVEGETISGTSYLLDVYMSLLPVYAFYTFARSGQLTEKKMAYWSVVFLFLTVFVYYKTQVQIMTRLYDIGLEVDNVTNNTAYTFLGLMPALVVFRKKPLVQYIFLLICGVFIFLSMKRGAIFIFTIVLVYFIYNNIKDEPSNKKKKIKIILSILILIGGVVFVSYLLENNSFFLDRVDQTKSGESSGRNDIYKVYYNHFINENNIFYLLFGNGANGGLKFASVSAHNDWLEIAISQGLIGLLLYVYYWLCFAITWVRSNKVPISHYAIGIFFLVYFIATFFSMSFNSIVGPASMILGYYLAVYDLSRRKNVAN